MLKNTKLRHIGLLMCFTNAAVKGIFVLIIYFWCQDVPYVKTYAASRCPQHQVSRVKLSGVNTVTSRCPALNYDTGGNIYKFCEVMTTALSSKIARFWQKIL